MHTNRRNVIRSLAGGGLILPGLLSEMLAAEDNPLAPKKPHFAPKAKRVIFMFMNGGVSHVDTFDPKPFLTKNHDLRQMHKEWCKNDYQSDNSRCEVFGDRKKDELWHQNIRQCTKEAVPES